ncbi:MAG: hypothetical protein AB7V40_08420, partial [Methyloceanibacter sp.]
ARDDNRPRFDRASWHAKAGILALAAGAGLVTFITLPERGSLAVAVGVAAAFVALIYFLARDVIGWTGETETAAADAGRMSFLVRPRSGARHSSTAAAEPGAQSAAGFLERFRRNLDLETAEPAPAPRGGNELRHYLNKRLATSHAETRKPFVPKSETGRTALKSLDAVLDHILAAGQGGAPRALLVGGAPPITDATAETISIARTLVAAGDQVVLLDLAHGAHSVSAALGLPRFPGLADLAAGKAQFDDVIAIDAETPLHVIAAGNPRFAAEGSARIAAIFAALTEAYDSVVLHADREALRRIAPELRFELSIAVAICAKGAGATADLNGFAALGCRTVALEQASKDHPRFLGWAASL